MKIERLVRAVENALTDELRRMPWKGSENAKAGHCYVACEALFHLTGGKLRPFFVKHEGAPHWFLKGPNGEIVDPTAEQFKTPVPYEQGKGKGFLTKQPSKRAQIVIDRVKSALIDAAADQLTDKNVFDVLQTLDYDITGNEIEFTIRVHSPQFRNSEIGVLRARKINERDVYPKQKLIEQFREALQHGSVFVVEDIEVVDELKGRGIGKRLYQAALKQVIDLGGGALAPNDVITPGKTSPAARSVWRSLLESHKAVGPFVITKTQAVATVKQTRDPFRNLPQDTRDAMQHAEQMDENVPDYKWHITKSRNMSLGSILALDDISSWGEWAFGELKGLDPDELFDAMRSFRGLKWAETASTWLRDGFPAVVVIETPEYTGVSDGRGRASLAYGLGLKSIPAVLMKAERLPHQTASMLETAADRIAATQTYTLQDIQNLMRDMGVVYDSLIGDLVELYQKWQFVEWPSEKFVIQADQGNDDDWDRVRDYARMGRRSMPPVIAVPSSDHPGEYEIVDGNHRAAACEKRRWKVPALVPLIVETADRKPSAAINQYLKWHEQQTKPSVHGRRIWPNGVVTSIAVDDGAIYLGEIRATKKGKGFGSAVMQQLTDQADKLGLVMRLEAVPFTTSYQEDQDGKATERLMKWYEGFGFESLHGGEEMVRWPVR